MPNITVPCSLYSKLKRVASKNRGSIDHLATNLILSTVEEYTPPPEHIRAIKKTLQGIKKGKIGLVPWEEVAASIEAKYGWRD